MQQRESGWEAERCILWGVCDQLCENARRPQLALKVARRLTTVIERLCADTFETDALLEQVAAARQQALAAAVTSPVPASQRDIVKSCV